MECVYLGLIEVYMVCDFLGWYGYECRGSFIVWVIKKYFVDLKISVILDFEGVYIDGKLSFLVIFDIDVVVGFLLV